MTHVKMPYSRRYSRRPRRRYTRRRYTSRRPTAQAGSDYLGTAAKALAVAYGVKQMLNVEKKYTDTSITHTPGTLGTIELVNGISQGDTDQTRDGNQCKMIFINWRLTITINAAATATSVRIIVIVKKDNDSVTPNIAEVLDSTGSLFNAMYNRDTIHKFRVLYDKRLVLRAADRTMVALKFKRKMQTRIRFDGVGSASSDISKNGLYVITISNEAVNFPAFGGVFRVSFVDN